MSPCIANLDLPTFDVGDEIVIEAKLTARLLSGDATWRIKYALDVVSMKTCARVRTSGGNGEVGPGLSSLAVLKITWDRDQPPGIYELRATIHAEKKVEGVEPGKAEELIALETCLFKIKPTSDFGYTGVVKSMLPCNEVIKAGGALKAIPFANRADLKVLKDDKGRYEAVGITELWDINAAKLLNVPGEERVPLKAPDQTVLAQLGAVIIKEEIRALNVFRLRIEPIRVPTSSSSSSAGTEDPCDKYLEKFLRTCQFTALPADDGSSSSSSGNP